MALNKKRVRALLSHLAHYTFSFSQQKMPENELFKHM